MGKLLFLWLLLIVCFCSPAKRQTVSFLKLDGLEQRFEKGKDTVYIVNFWASWCMPCLKELPHFEKLGQSLKESKVKVLLVSLDFKSKLKSAVVPLVKRLKLKNEVYLLDEADQQRYIERIDKQWSGALPATLLVNKTKNKRVFKEQEFTYPELIDFYKQNK